MFCPNCSQEVAGETRFCSRCGFPLNVVKALFANEGLAAAEVGKKASRTFSKRDISIGLSLMFAAAFGVAAATGSLPQFHIARILLLIISWVALLLLINAKPLILYFWRGDAPGTGAEQVDERIFGGNRAAEALPPTLQQPAASYLAPPAVTNEIGPPPVVTESTTNLLKDSR